MRDLSLHLMDIIQNSISARATKVETTISIDTALDELTITVADNGWGMSEELISQVTDPFITTRQTRKVGLGISLFKASAQRADGDLNISSELGKGTILKAWFKISHIDRLPLGDIGETIASVILASPEIAFSLNLVKGEEQFKFDSQEVKNTLGDVPITEYEVIAWIKEYIKEGIETIFGGILNEIASILLQ